ncbi:MAG: GHMP kinase, partial [Candidatus Peregrinibacteria bacterium]|nr:GHMP kinase [Candidatus Peregrinibacteria bacterium]
SSSFTVGLLHALHVVKGEFVSPEQLAEEAIEIEVVRLARPMGKQDHYAAAFGGMNEILFMPDESTIVNLVVCHKDMREKFFGHLMAFYTFQTRDSHSILKEQTENTVNKMDVLKEMRDMVTPFRKVLEESGSVEELGRVLDTAWQRKKTLQGKISNSQIDTLYEAAKGAGAIGGKLLGAGGGGFLLMVVPPEKRESVESVMHGAMELDFTYEPLGSTIIYYKED